jgi:hypothetical protein
LPLKEIVIDAVIDVDWSRKMRPTPLSRSRMGSTVALPPGGRVSYTALAPDPCSELLPARPLTDQSSAHRARRSASLAVTIIQGIPIDQSKDIRSFLIRSDHQLAARCESAPQRLIFVAGWIGALQATGKGTALLIGDDQRRKATAPSFNLGNSLPLASPCARKGHCIRAEHRR